MQTHKALTKKQLLKFIEEDMEDTLYEMTVCSPTQITITEDVDDSGDT
jgi:hypothetical protein